MSSRSATDGYRVRGGAPTRFDAFLDAAFAFAVSLLVIAGNEVPNSIARLLDALKDVPAFAASFIMVALFWNAHDGWTRRFGLQDAMARFLGLLLVFLVLVFVYPLKMLAGSFFAWISQGALSTRFELHSVLELQIMFYTYGIAFSLLGGVMTLLYLHAWQQREALALSTQEARATRLQMWRWAMLPLFGALSCLSAWLLPARPPSWQQGIPGLVYFGLSFAHYLLTYRQLRIWQQPA